MGERAGDSTSPRVETPVASSPELFEAATPTDVHRFSMKPSPAEQEKAMQGLGFGSFSLTDSSKTSAPSPEEFKARESSADAKSEGVKAENPADFRASGDTTPAASDREGPKAGGLGMDSTNPIRAVDSAYRPGDPKTPSMRDVQQGIITEFGDSVAAAQKIQTGSLMEQLSGAKEAPLKGSFKPVAQGAEGQQTQAAPENQRSVTPEEFRAVEQRR